MPAARIVLVVLLLAIMFSMSGCREGGGRANLSPWPSASTERPGVPATASPDAVAPEPTERTPIPVADCSGTDKTRRSWYFQPTGAGEVPGIPGDAARILATYEALWRVPTEEDHLVGNHTQTHPSLPSIAGDADGVAEEYRSVERQYRELTGGSLAPFERPPRGEYSERTLCMVSQLGYTSVMWSFAHRDWLVDDQPPVNVTYQRIVDGTHPGAILLLHSVSSSNTEALPRVIDTLRERGYRFGSLTEVR